MNINASIIDQQVRGLAEKLRSEIDLVLGKVADDTLARSVGFLLLVEKVLLGLTEEEAIDSVTEGGNDFGVDAIDISDVVDGEFAVTLVQGK